MATSLADTSGAFGSVIMDVTSIIEHAVRRCGVSASVITAEQQQSARENLFLILSNLATKGLSLWCVQKFTLEVAAGVSELLLPVGVIDVLEGLFRTATSAAATSAGPGVVAYDAGASATPTVMGAVVTPAANGRYTFVLESSSDNAVWVPRGSADLVFAGVPIGFDASTFVAAQYWRVRDTLDPGRVLTTASFLSNINDVTMGRLTRSSYAQMPNKAQASLQPLQFWYDKQFYQPRMVLWPVPSQTAFIRIYVQQQIQDPGSFVNAVQVPQRWLDAVIALLAPRVFLELPKELVASDRYEVLTGVAASLLRDAEDSETDGAPIKFAPNLVPYTR